MHSWRKGITTATGGAQNSTWSLSPSPLQNESLNLLGEGKLIPLPLSTGEKPLQLRKGNKNKTTYKLSLREWKGYMLGSELQMKEQEN